MPILSRRRLLTISLLAVPALRMRSAFADTTGQGNAQVQDQIARLEKKHKGRLGIAILNMGSGRRVSHRGNERFLFNSTGKVITAARVLACVDHGKESLDRHVTFTPSDLISWSPVTERHTGAPGMSIAELCQAAIAWSDNTAANLLMASVGGPASITDYLRSLGDNVTRFDRMEPALNEHDHESDERDTTTPLAMMDTLQTLLFGNALSPGSRHQLAAWMIASRTGDSRLRAGMPAHWLVGDKTGTNAVGNANDIGIAWPTERGAIIAVAYCYLPSSSKEEQNQVIADIGRLAASV